MLVQNLIYTQNFQRNRIFGNHHNSNYVSFYGVENPVDKQLRKVPPELIKELRLYNLKLEDVLAQIIDYIIKKDQLSSKDRIAFHEVFKKVFPMIHTDEHKLGAGYHSAVYEINDKYALKCPINVTQSELSNIKSSMYIPLNRFKDLETFYGSEVMFFGQSRGFSILRNLGKHIPAGVPQNVTRENRYHYYISEYLPIFSKVPQESYDAITKDCVELNNCGIQYYNFDYYNPSNIVLKDNKLFWVDEITDKDTPNSTTQLLEMLLLKANPDVTIKNGYGHAISDAQTIFKRIMLASVRTKLQVNSAKDNDTLNIWNILLNNLKAKESVNAVLHELKKIYNIEDTQTRIMETNKLLERIFPEK